MDDADDPRFLERRIATLAEEAETLAAAGDVDAAIRRLRTTCELALRNLGRDHPRLPGLLRRLGQLYRHRGFASAAQEAFRLAGEVGE